MRKAKLNHITAGSVTVTQNVSHHHLWCHNRLWPVAGQCTVVVSCRPDNQCALIRESVECSLLILQWPAENDHLPRQTFRLEGKRESYIPGFSCVHRICDTAVFILLQNLLLNFPLIQIVQTLYIVRRLPGMTAAFWKFWSSQKYLELPWYIIYIIWWCTFGTFCL